MPRYFAALTPIYVAFALILFGQFLVRPNWILVVYMGAAVGLFHLNRPCRGD